jgi:hypothetical protein
MLNIIEARTIGKASHGFKIRSWKEVLLKSLREELGTIIIGD